MQNELWYKLYKKGNCWISFFFVDADGKDLTMVDYDFFFPIQFEDVMAELERNGFTNKGVVEFEGLYYDIATGKNASTAILEGKTFAVTNRDIFRNKEKRGVFGPPVLQSFRPLANEAWRTQPSAHQKSFRDELLIGNHC